MMEEVMEMKEVREMMVMNIKKTMVPRLKGKKMME